MNTEVVTLDVRADLREGREPFARIMAAVEALRPNQALRLIAPIEPVPLLRVMTRRGFEHSAQPTPAGDWEVLFQRASNTEPPAAAGSDERPPCPAFPATRAAESAAESAAVDVRGLEPPMPLVKALEAVAGLAPGATLRVVTDRRPMHLYAQLEARGFRGESEEQPDGSFVTHIRHV